MQDGLTLWEVAGTAVRDAGPGLAGIALILGTLALALAHTQGRRLLRADQRVRALADSAFDGVLIVRNDQIVTVNAALVRLMGVAPAWFDDRTASMLLHGGGPSHLDGARDCHLILPDGASHPVQVVARLADGGAERVLTIRDLAPTKAAQAQIHRLTYGDLLTGAGNRRMLDDALTRMIMTAGRSDAGVALLSIDLHRFRALTDSFGPAIGDQILVEAARRLSATVRETDVVARVGSEEFAIAQPMLNRATDAATLADRIIAEMALPFEIDRHAISVDVSIGIALYPEDGASPVELMTRSTLALNRARQAGRGAWRYCEPGLDQALRERHAMAQDLGLAIRAGEFSLVYQPFFDTQTLEVAGYEALLRWTHPERGAVSPATFIPIAEECGLILPLSLWVLRTACAEAATWTRPLVIAVNLSPAQFVQEDVAGRVDAVLRETGLAPARLELEITEGVLMDDTERALDMLTRLRAMGVMLTMDDFGTGYSSLSCLKKFPFDKLKIDGSFIRDLDEEEDAQPIVQAIIAMSRSLHLEVTAEGVETARQLSYLREEGCRFVQGFLVGRPHHASQIRWNTRPVGWDPAGLAPPEPMKLSAAGT
jgi:diguanylate cyclase